MGGDWFLVSVAIVAAAAAAWIYGRFPITKRSALNRDLAKQSPETVFGTPLEIVAEAMLTRGEKLATLNRWRQHLYQQLNAAGEGMRTQGYSSQQVKTLELIEQAKEALA